MIALQSLKYFIWDYCLTKLLDTLEINFNTGNNYVTGADVKDGMIFRTAKYIGDKSRSRAYHHNLMAYHKDYFDNRELIIYGIFIIGTPTSNGIKLNIPNKVINYTVDGRIGKTALNPYEWLFYP